MQNLHSHHRKERRRSLALLLLAPLALGIAWAAPIPSPVASDNTNAVDPNTQPIRPSDETAVKKLPTIIVTAATRTAQSPDTTATTTTVITHQELDDAKYASVPDALQSVPGMSVVTSGMPGGQTSVFIHGLDSNQTLVTIDGRRQAVGLSGADDNLANLTLDDVDQIEVVRTPVSSINGGSAMGGVINLVTLTGKGLTTPQSSVSEEVGSFQTFRENAQSRGADGNFDYAVSASRQDSIYPALSPGAPASFSPGFAGQADQYRNTAYRGNFGYQITPEIYVDLHSAYNNAYTSSPGPFYAPDPTANLLIEDWNLSPEVVAKVTDFYSTKLFYTHDQQRQAYSDPYGFANYGPGTGFLTRLQINADSVDWQNDFKITHNWTITAGLQGDNRTYYEFDNSVGTDIFNSHDNNIGGYISSQWQPFAGLNILNSGRYDAYSQFGGAFTWRQAASYTVAPTHTVLHASVSKAFTQPPLQDLLLSYPSAPPFPSYLANPNLGPETDLGWEAGVEQPLWDGRVTPSATYFHNDIHGEIANVFFPSTNSYVLENVNQATTDGVDAGLSVKPWSNVTANVTYTYLNAVNDTTQMRLVRRPRNNLQFTGTWNPIAPLTFTLGGNWVVGQQDVIYNPATYTSAQVDVPDYFTLRASATYQINDHVSLWIRGENLTDRNYQPVAGYYAPSIAGYGGVKVSF